MVPGFRGGDRVPADAGKNAFWRPSRQWTT
jgi:hypothetical protein